LPRTLPGVERIEWLIINDGSTDRTIEIAKTYGVDHIINFKHHQGLAKAFIEGLETSLSAGADIIVNTDADNQYSSHDIPKLIEPILSGKADIVIGARPISQIKHFSLMKKALQKLGSWVVSIFSNTDIPDVTSGFRAISRDAAMRLNVFTQHTYTLEMIIQAGQKGMAITSIPITTNEDLRPSRLIKNIPSYIKHSIFTILRIFMTYRPLRFFMIMGGIPFALGFLIGVRWLFLYFSGTPRTHLPSLVLASILILIGFQLWIFGLIADLMAVNRKMLEDIQLQTRRYKFDSKKDL
ncbi:MAG TPA: glycosyltransferase family 2 protein, partial [Thermodesulfobacteriota bacterium]